MRTQQTVAVMKSVSPITTVALTIRTSVSSPLRVGSVQPCGVENLVCLTVNVTVLMIVSALVTAAQTITSSVKETRNGFKMNVST